MTEIAWLTSAYPWSGNTFAGIFFRSQARALARAGLDLTVLAPLPVAPWPLPHLGERWRLRSLAPRDDWDGRIRVVRPTYLSVPSEPGWAQPDRFIANAAWRRRADWSGSRLIHGHYSLFGLAAWRLAHRAGVPFVLTFHGSDLNSWPARHADRLGDLRVAVREAAAVFAVSSALVSRLRDLTGAEAIHLPIGIDHRAVEASALSKVAARQSLGLSSEGVVALFVGHLVKEKGVREFVSAILKLGDPFVGVLVGAGPESGFGTSDRRAGGRVVYAGLRPHDDVLRFMAAADVLVLPSFGEGLPTVLVEAGSVGLPVVGSAVGGIPELLADGRGIVLPEVSTEAVAGALVGFNAARDAAAVAAKRLQSHVRAEYDVDVNAARLLDHYAAIDGAIGAQARGRDA